LTIASLARGRHRWRPAVRLLLAGAALWALQQWSVAPARKAIVIGDDVVRGLREDHRRRTGRLPTADEEASLVRAAADDEILYREALALGLDKGDVVVRRRLVQNMTFLLEETNSLVEPTDDELAAHLAAYPERFTVPERWWFEHVFVRRDADADSGADGGARARALRERLERGDDPERLGDPYPRSRTHTASSAREVDAELGAGFAARLASLPLGAWSGPVESSFGWHLVRVSRREAARLPELAEVRAAVREDWRRVRRDELDRRALAELRERYQVATPGAP
jgi:hypothetical protein